VVVLVPSHYALPSSRYALRRSAYYGFPHKNRRSPVCQRADEFFCRFFLTHLAVAGRVSASTQNQALNALVFLYQQVPRFGMMFGNDKDLS